MNKFKVNDCVWVIDPNYKPRRSPVRKVGHKYVIVGEVKYAFDGVRADGWTGSILTDAEYEAQLMRQSVIDGLREFKIEACNTKLPTATLKVMLEVAAAVTTEVKS